ncbi:hypothetical protein CEV31_0016 [Brucella thiophenivorans]|uniref:Uncharacterized protein n=1 Tax=Brucella thiophenivorans TaxID=571255 RepID=A0A256G869_9HYPH|nr:hypothetical protein CEV31_0016 [Brucella thiophenivorans]
MSHDKPTSAESRVLRSGIVTAARALDAVMNDFSAARHAIGKEPGRKQWRKTKAATLMRTKRV